MGVTLILLLTALHTSIILLPDLFKYKSTTTGVLIAVTTYPVLMFIYIWFLKVVMTNPGTTSPEWVHPLKDQNHSIVGDEERIPPLDLGQIEEQYEVPYLTFITIENYWNVYK